MRSVWLLALAASGCRTILGIEAPPPPPPPLDARADGPVDAPDPCMSWHPQGFDACATPRLAESLPPLLAGMRYVYDTSTAGGTLYDPSGTALLRSTTVLPLGGSAIAVLALGSLDLEGAGVTLTVIGTKPLLVVSWSTITIGAGTTIDAGSHLGAVSDSARAPAVLGPGANQLCASGAGAEGAVGSMAPFAGGSGGGGGGSFQAAGGRGGLGGITGTELGGTAGSVDAAPAFRGGCPGGASGPAGRFATPPSSAATQAPGGGGGGAIRFVARDRIEIAGQITASGAGGAGGPLNSSCGGGGGGSGGYIGFEAPTVAIRGVVAANGGGGGSGGVGGRVGLDGADGGPGSQPAPGGNRVTAVCDQAGTEVAGGGAGGPGGAAGPPASPASLHGQTGADTGGCAGGGGGGGGGAGYIVATTPSLAISPGATVSPAVVMP